MEEVKETAGFIKRAFSKRPPGRQAKRKEDSDESSSEDETKIIRKERKLAHNPLVQKTATKVRSTATTEDGERKKEFAFSAERSTAPRGPGDMGATATLEIETPHDRDAQALFEKSQAINAELKDKGGDDNVYRGMNNYKTFLPEKKGNSQGNASSGMVRKGPIRAPTNVRASVRWDYAPDICKDYKETGFCGFGDSCIFLHDRSDYKHGWQLEREVESKTYGQSDVQAKKYEIATEEEKNNEKMEENFPFKCLICRSFFRNPISTKCKHFFCEKCALDNYKKSKRCFACGQQTMGVFNSAKELLAKIQKNEKTEEIFDEEEKEKKGVSTVDSFHQGHDHAHPATAETPDDVDDYEQQGQ